MRKFTLLLFILLFFGQRQEVRASGEDESKQTIQICGHSEPAQQFLRRFGPATSGTKIAADQARFYKNIKTHEIPGKDGGYAVLAFSQLKENDDEGFIQFWTFACVQSLAKLRWSWFKQLDANFSRADFEFANYQISTGRRAFGLRYLKTDSGMGGVCGTTSSESTNIVLFDPDAKEAMPIFSIDFESEDFSGGLITQAKESDEFNCENHSVSASSVISVDKKQPSKDINDWIVTLKTESLDTYGKSEKKKTSKKTFRFIWTSKGYHSDEWDKQRARPLK